MRKNKAGRRTAQHGAVALGTGLGATLGAILGAALSIALPATANAAHHEEMVPPCESVGMAEALCGVRSPEDLDLTLDRKQLIVSQIGAGFDGQEVWNPGALSAIDLRSNRVTPLYPRADKSADAKPTAGWGDASCPGEIGAALSPHGIHVSRRPDGKEQLLVVNHGGRESVELFEIKQYKGKLAIKWRGCALPPQPSMLNDVAALPDGGFVTTNYTNLGGPNSIAKASEAIKEGKNTGELLRWHPQRGFSVVPNTAGKTPNGVQTDAAGRYAYVATKPEVQKIDIEKGGIVATTPITQADNVNWTEDGRVLTARITDSALVYKCFQESKDKACLAPFEVIAIDPETMKHEVVGRHSGPPMGAATVAAQHGDHLYIGTFRGDRVLRMPYRKPMQTKP